MRPSATFQIADGPDADARAFSECLLSEIQVTAMLPKQVPKRWCMSGCVGRHGDPVMYPLEIDDNARPRISGV